MTIWTLITLTLLGVSFASQPPDGPRPGSVEGQRRTGPDQPAPRPRGGEPGVGRPQDPVMTVLDTNGDGVLSPQEIAQAPAALQRLDRDGDGRLGREELRPAPGREGEGGRQGEGTGGRRGDSPPPNSPRQPGSQGRSLTSPHQRPAAPAPPGSKPTVAARITPGPVPGFVVIPGGEFDMGDHHDLGGQEHSNDEVPIHHVRLDSFAMAIHETTNEQYCAYLNAARTAGSILVREGRVYSADGNSLYCDTHASDDASSIEWKDGKFAIVDHRARHCVVCIRWHGAAAYCNWLSQRLGHSPLYDSATWQCDYATEGIRLPTEAEWEYAGRGGLTGPYYIFPWGDDPDFTKANWPNSEDPYESGPYPLTAPVGFYDGTLRRRADFGWPGSQATYQTSSGVNGYGLFDMAGNAWEWVNDWYDHGYYAASPANSPRGPEQGQPMRDGQPYRVLRGGSWFNGQWGHSRVSNRNPSYYRGPDDPNHRWYHIGFRVVLSRPLTSK